MSSPVYRMIYLGKFADIDTDESTLAAEHAGSVFGGKSFGSAGDPLYGRLVDVTMNDTDGDGTIYVNNYSGTQEKISYTLPDGTSFSREIDSGFTSANVEISRLRPDGSIEKVMSTVRIIQDTSGNAFMAPPPPVHRLEGRGRCDHRGANRRDQDAVGVQFYNWIYRRLCWASWDGKVRAMLYGGHLDPDRVWRPDGAGFAGGRFGLDARSWLSADPLDRTPPS